MNCLKGAFWGALFIGPDLRGFSRLYPRPVQPQGQRYKQRRDKKRKLHALGDGFGRGLGDHGASDAH